MFRVAETVGIICIAELKTFSWMSLWIFFKNALHALEHTVDILQAEFWAGFDL